MMKLNLFAVAKSMDEVAIDFQLTHGSLIITDGDLVISINTTTYELPLITVKYRGECLHSKTLEADVAADFILALIALNRSKGD